MQHEGGARARDVVDGDGDGVRPSARKDAAETRATSTNVHHVERAIGGVVRGAVRDDGGGLAAPDGGVAESIARIHQTGDLLASHRDGDAEGCGGGAGPLRGAGDGLQARGAPDVRDFPGFHDDVDG